MNGHDKTSVTLLTLTVLFLGLAAAFIFNLWGRPVASPSLPLVNTNFLDKATARRSYADLVKAGEDLSDFDCYACHEKGKPPPLRFDTNQNLIIPKEHSDIVMHHGSHERNNNCFNCHNETNLEQFQTRDKRELTLSNSTPLCGSCHGPTYRDWEAGVHGRTSGYWDRSLGAMDRKLCVNCHNPHSPKFPGRKPAPGPHPLRGGENSHATTATIRTSASSVAGHCNMRTALEPCKWRSAGVLACEFTGRPAPRFFARRDAARTRSRDGYATRFIAGSRCVAHNRSLT